MSNPRRMENRTALITGANRGLGYTVARAYAAEGARVLLAGRNEDALARLAGEIRSQGGKADVLSVDLEDSNSVHRLAASVSSLVQSLDVFVANAAVLGARVPIVGYPLDTWLQTFKVNVNANLILLGALDPLLRRSDAGRIIILSAGVARTPKAGTGSYAVSKAALEAMARIYAVEAAGSAIRINIVNPGPTRTQMRARAVPDEDPLTLKTPDDIAPLFVELALPACDRQGEWINADLWLQERRK